MAVEYQIRRTDVDGRNYASGKSLSQVIDELRAHGKQAGGPCRLRDVRPHEGEFGPKRSIPVGMRRLSYNLKTAKPGDCIAIVFNNFAGPSYRIRKVETGLPERQPMFGVYNLNSVDEKLQRACRVAAAYDYGVRTNGLAFTRKVAGSSTYSQHSKWAALDCKGNAADLYFPLPPPVGNNMSRQRRLVAYMRGVAPELDLYMIISEKTYYSVENDFDGRYYTGIAHVSHSHYEASPRQFGSVCW